MAEQIETSLRTLPLLALKNSALFPGLMMPLAVGRKNSVAAVEAALGTEEKEIVVVAQRDAGSDAPHAADVYTVGTRATIRRHHHARPDQLDIMVLGVERVVIVKVEEDAFMHARIRPLPLPDDSSRETEALALSLVELGTKFLQLAQGGNVQTDIARMFAAEQDPLQLAFMIASVMNLDASKEQALLETPTRLEGLRMVLGWLSHEVDVLELRNKIANEARTEMSKEQREYVLRQQKRAIEQELGEKNGDQAEVQQLRERLDKADLPEDIRKEAEREMGRLEKLPSAQPEFSVIRTWLEYVIELPWTKKSEDSLDLKHAREILDEDHFGITKVKERIIEQLAVLKLNPEAKAPILCLVGAPGGRQDLAGPIHRASSGPQIRAHEPGRIA